MKRVRGVVLWNQFPSLATLREQKISYVIGVDFAKVIHTNLGSKIIENMLTITKESEELIMKHFV